MSARHSLLLALGLLLLLSGCQSVPGLTGAASIRIEVDAYKGPLLKEWEVQWGELFGLIDEALSSLEFLTNEVVISAHRLGCAPKDNRGSDGKGTEFQVVVRVPAKHGWKKRDSAYESCHIMASILSDLEGIRLAVGAHARDFAARRSDKTLLCWCDGNDCYPDVTGCTTQTEGARGHDRVNLLEIVSQLSAQIRQKGHDWAQYHAATRPKERRTRITIANTAAFLNEYGNILGSRADSLMKQEVEDDIDRTSALSVMLRDAATTDFLNLYDWNDAMTRRGGETRADRVRLVERLVSDANWVNVNTVFAAGQGKFMTALVKDDIGNWNLKSFDNDPTELVDAYKQVGLAALKAAAEAAAAAYTGGGSEVGPVALDALIGMARNTADRTALGTHAAESSIEPAMLHHNVVRSLRRLGQRRDARWTALQTELDGAKTAFDDAAAELARKDEALDTSEDERRELRDELQDRLDRIDTTPPTPAADPELLNEIDTLRRQLETQEQQVQQARDARSQAYETKLTAERAKQQLEQERARFPEQTRSEIAAVLQLHGALLDDLERSIVME